MGRRFNDVKTATGRYILIKYNYLPFKDIILGTIDHIYVRSQLADVRPEFYNPPLEQEHPIADIMQHVHEFLPISSKNLYDMRIGTKGVDLDMKKRLYCQTYETELYNSTTGVHATISVNGNGQRHGFTTIRLGNIIAIYCYVEDIAIAYVSINTSTYEVISMFDLVNTTDPDNSSYLKYLETVRWMFDDHQRIITWAGQSVGYNPDKRYVELDGYRLYYRNKKTDFEISFIDINGRYRNIYVEPLPGWHKYCDIDIPNSLEFVKDGVYER